MIFVSACLIGENCKYSGGNNRCDAIIEYLKDKTYFPVCPEVLGGLPTPRPPAEIKGDKVWNKAGQDVTAAFQKGAETTLAMALEKQPSLCILKANSPSCGNQTVYDGTFTGKLTEGRGLTARKLTEAGFKVVNEKDF